MTIVPAYYYLFLENGTSYAVGMKVSCKRLSVYVDGSVLHNCLFLMCVLLPKSLPIRSFLFPPERT